MERAVLAIFAILLPAFAGPTTAQTPEDPLAGVVARVAARDPSAEADSFVEFLSLLPVDEDDRRGYDGEGRPQPDLLAARDTIHAALSDRLRPSGGTVEFEDFSARGYAGRNIVGLLPGDGPGASRRYLIGAHYDSAQNPGADDNGSGVAGVLLAAHALGAFRFEATIAFVLFDLEEARPRGWGLGSRAHAAGARRGRADLRGVVVLDMIAHDHDGAGRAVVSRRERRPHGGSADLAAELLDALATRSALTARAVTGDAGSDHYRFAQRRFPAVLLIEDLDEVLEPLNPFWHGPRDCYRDAQGNPNRWAGRDYIDADYAAEMIRAVAAWAATKAVLLGPR